MLDKDRTNWVTDNGGPTFSLLTGVTWIQAVPANGPIELAWRETSDLVSNNEDRRFLVAARGQSDLILTSSKTASAESYRPSRHAPIVVLDRSAPALSANQLRNLHSGDLVHSDALTAVETLADEKRILLESGPKLASLFAQSGSLQRVWLSITDFGRDMKSADRSLLMKERAQGLATVLDIANLAVNHEVWDGRNAYLDLVVAR